MTTDTATDTIIVTTPEIIEEFRIMGLLRNGRTFWPRITLLQTDTRDTKIYNPLKSQQYFVSGGDTPPLKGGAYRNAPF